MTLDDDSKKDDSKKSHSVCAFATTGNFTKLVLGMLSDSLKADLEHHAIEENCEACKKTWFDVSEIASGINKPTDQELTLILRIFSGKIWHNKEEKLIARVIADIDKKEEEKDAKLSQTEELNSQKIEIIGQRVSTLEIGQTALTSDIKSISYRLTALIVAIFAITFTLFALLLVKNEYVKNTPDSSSLPTATVPATRAVPVTSTSTNLYQQLDLAIDNYLGSNDKSHFEEAESIALEIQDRNEDNYGVDLVSYYRSAQRKDFNVLASLRNDLKKLDVPFLPNDTEAYLARTQQTEEKFLILGDIIESYKVKYFIAKRYMLVSNPGYRSIIDQGIKYSESNNYLFLKVHFLLSRAKLDSNSADNLKARKGLEDAIIFIKKIGLAHLFPSAGMSLAAVYLNQGRYQDALKISEESLSIKTDKYTTTISLMYIAGMASFYLGKDLLSDKYFWDSIRLAQEHDESLNLSIAYSLAGSSAIEKGNFQLSDELLKKAEDVANKITYNPTKIELILTIRGYQAKAQLKKGNYLEASMLYRESLGKINDVGERITVLQSAELNEGLALALKKIDKKQSTYYHGVAAYFFQQSVKKNQNVNCLISFLPSKCG